MVSGVLAVGAAIPEAEVWPLPQPAWKLPEEQMMTSFGKPPLRTVSPADGVAAFPEAGEQSLWRFRAVLTVPETGDYRLFLTAQAAGDLWVSDDASLAAKRKIALVASATGPGEWSRFPTQVSGPMHWKKGEMHAIEMLWKNVRGKGHAAIAWQRPGATGPEPLPISDGAGNFLLGPYQGIPGDADGDDLPDDWETKHKLDVDGSKGSDSGYGDPDGDGLTNQEEFFGGTDPHGTAGQPGLVHLKLWRSLDSTYKSWLGNGYPDDMPWILDNQKAETGLRHLGKLQPSFGTSAVWARFLLNAENTGYHRLSVEAGGALQVMVSDDDTPGKLRLLWYDCTELEARPSGFGPESMITESGWIHLAAGQPRLVDIRFVHNAGENFLNAEWTTPDGRRQKIPDGCVSPWPADALEKLPPYHSMADGQWGEVLRDVRLESEPLDLSTVKALTSGWSEFRPEELHHGKEMKDPELQKGLACAWGGSLEIPFTTRIEGYAVLSTRMMLVAGIPVHVRVMCEREIDGIRFGREPIAAVNNEVTVFRCVTPWLEAGKHTLRLHFELMENPAHVVLFQPSLAVITDPSLSGKIQARLAADNRFLPQRGNGGSLVSPACVEITSRVSQSPELRLHGHRHPLQPATAGTWWADIPLPESGEPLVLDADFGADRMHAKASARWEETRISEHSELFVRVGDSLRLTAAPAGGRVENPGISFRGREIPTPPGKPHVCRFDKPGTETVTSLSGDGSDHTAAHRLTIHVIPRRSSPRDAAPVVAKGLAKLAGASDPTLRLTDLPEGAWPDGGDALSFRAVPGRTQGGRPDWLVFNTRAGKLPAVLRAGPAGPVLGGMSFTGVTSGYELNTFNEDVKSHLGFMQIATHVSGLPDGWQIRSSVNRGAVFMFPDADNPKAATVWPWRMGNSAVGECWLKLDRIDAGLNGLYQYLVRPDAEEER